MIGEWAGGEFAGPLVFCLSALLDLADGAEIAIIIHANATLAQPVEQRTRNASVAGSNPAGGSCIPARWVGIFVLGGWNGDLTEPPLVVKMLRMRE